MNKYYLQPILFFSILIPIIMLAAGIGITQFTQNKLIGDFSKKERLYKKEMNQLKILKKLQSENANKQAKLDTWKKIMASEDSFGNIKKRFKAAKTDSNSTKTLQIPDINKENIKLSQNPSPYSSFSLFMEGTYADIQHCLLHVESHLPNSMTHNMLIKPKPNSNLIQFNAKYIVWESN